VLNGEFHKWFSIPDTIVLNKSSALNLPREIRGKIDHENISMLVDKKN
jgi:hypothetical protein